MIYSMVLVFFFSGLSWAADPWKVLQDKYGSDMVPKVIEKKKETTTDPWEKLRLVCMPFTQEAEEAALSDPEAGRRIAAYMHRALRSYAGIIHEAAMRFDIPEEIIGAVIMVESGGDANARAGTSSAKGLMQTITGTFRDARNGLLSQGVFINDNPFDPYASIMAGSWYLDRMFEAAFDDGKHGLFSRQDLFSWRYPAEYYYAGPKNGRKGQNVVIMYAGGRRVVIDKASYSRKVLRWARIMEMQRKNAERPTSNVQHRTLNEGIASQPYNLKTSDSSRKHAYVETRKRSFGMQGGHSPPYQIYVIPAVANAESRNPVHKKNWIPAFAGMTLFNSDVCQSNCRMNNKPWPLFKPQEFRI